MSKKKFYITTSIAYTNALPHLGFALELVQADVVARYQRILKKDVWFLTGTDEHGIKIFEKAKEANKTPADFCNEVSIKFRELTDKLNISNNDFIRTTDKKKHWPAVFKLWQKLKIKKDIYQKEYQGLYCVGCEAFILERDLIDKKCPNHQREPEPVKEKNYFFKLSKYSKKIRENIVKNKIKIIPEKKKKEILSFLDKGLEDVSFSRPKEKVAWGIPVPEDKSQLIYCWADALANYISAVGYADQKKDFKKYWPAEIHFIGKDIFKFHTLIWPGMLLSAGLELPRKIFIHGFITSDGKKMSKSLGNVINPFDLIEKYGTDAVRYFLLREIPSVEDGDFTYEKFEQRYNSDLANGLGNLVSRTTTLAEKFKVKPLKSLTEKSNKKNLRLKTEINKTKKKYKKFLEEFKFNEALMSIWDLIGFCDKYIDKEKPWYFDPAKDKEKQKQVIGGLLFTINEIAELLKPFLPETSKNISLKIKFQKTENLFPRIK